MTNLLLFQESQFSVSNSTAPTIHGAVTSGTPTLHSKESSIHNKHDLKDKRIEQLNAKLQALKPFIREGLYFMKKMIEDLQGQKATPNHSVVAGSLREGLIYLRNENLIKMKTITENQHLPSTLSAQGSSNAGEQSRAISNHCWAVLAGPLSLGAKYDWVFLNCVGSCELCLKSTARRALHAFRGLPSL